MNLVSFLTLTKSEPTAFAIVNYIINGSSILVQKGHHLEKIIQTIEHCAKDSVVCFLHFCH
jgi:hypothetical protein